MLESAALRWVRAIQLEDALLLAWFVIAEPFLSRLLGAAMASPRAATPAPWNWLAAGFCYLAALGALVCIVTRSGDEPVPAPSLGPPDMSTPSGYARLPMIVVLGIVLNTAAELSGLDRGEACMGVVTLIWFATLMVYPRLPRVPTVARRLLMSPAIIFSAWFYTDTIGGVLKGLDLPRLLGAYGTEQWGLVSFELTMLFVVTAFSYLMFVFAPRQVAGAGGSWFQWFVRFALYVLGVVLNLGPLQVIG